ncbi:MAG: DsbA family protein [Thiobacillus sp.]|nr:DsbA family protein [Thiobacillus sp.]
MEATLYYIHDPMCSWCWGFSPTWPQIRAQLPAKLPVVYLLGGLAPDTDAPMPIEMQAKLQQTWHTISQRLGTRFNFDFWTLCQPRRSTYPACRAVIAAQQQDAGEAMISAIQHAYYLDAKNPSDDATLVELAKTLGLDAERFALALNDPTTQHELVRQIAQGKALGAQGFPSLIYSNHSGNHFIRHDYLDPGVTLDQIRRLVSF